MITRIILIFLIFIVVLAMFGSVRRAVLGKSKKRGKIRSARKCPKCGVYQIGDGPCGCSK